MLEVQATTPVQLWDGVLIMERKTAELLAEKAMNDAIAIIQKELGTKDGGFASVFFSGTFLGRLDQAEELLVDYIQYECLNTRDSDD